MVRLEPGSLELITNCTTADYDLVGADIISKMSLDFQGERSWRDLNPGLQC